VVIQATVTGVAWLNFDSLGEGEPLDPGSVIVGDAGTFSNLVSAANRLAPAVTGLVDDVRDRTLPKVDEVLDKTSSSIDNIDGTVARFGEAADRTSNAAQTVEELLEANRENLNETLANLRDASQRAPRLMDDANLLVSSWTGAADSVRETLDGTGERLNLVLEDAKVIAEDLKQTSKETTATVSEVHSLISGNRGKIETIISRLRDTSSTLNLASAEIRRSPWRLLYRPDGSQRESLDLYDTARRFAEGAASLQDAAVALGDAANDPAADPQKVEQMLLELQQKFQEFDRIERALYQRLE
jgi:methyl-accepting chemotaxis protein